MGNGYTLKKNQANAFAQTANCDILDPIRAIDDNEDAHFYFDTSAQRRDTLML